MTERPILFSGPMVRAILDGRKTMTRRVVKPQPDNRTTTLAGTCTITKQGHWYKSWYGPVETIDDYLCPYCVGDTLWVRETWRTIEGTYVPGIQYREGLEGRYPEYEYLEQMPRDWNNTSKWRPSIFMPRLASRISLEVTAVRCERVQDITDDDAIAEGAMREEYQTYDGEPVEKFRETWEHLNSKRGYGWDVNPWVWVVSFKRKEST
jgi:hypothetical protein